MKTRFITVTNFFDSAPMMLSVGGIGGIYLEGGYTILKHSSHNNGGYRVKETPEEILKLISEAKEI